MSNIIIEENANAAFEADQEGSLVLESRPIMAWIAFSSRCNLHCAHCLRRTSRSQAVPENGDMSGELFEIVERELFPYLKRCHFGGNNLGEQLHANNWDRYFARARAYDFVPMIQTNGVLLNDERIEALVDAGCSIKISLEGATQDTYRGIRGHSLDELLETLRKICTERDRRKTGATVQLTWTALYDNIREIPQLITLAAEIGVDEVVVNHFSPRHEGYRYQSLVYHQGLTNEMLDEAERRSHRLGIKTILPRRFAVKPIHLIKERKSTVGTSNGNLQPCYHPWTSVSVDESGNVMPCCVSGMTMGNLKETPFESIWNSKRYQTLRRTVNTPNPVFSDCRSCGIRNIDILGGLGRVQEPLELCSDPAILLAGIDSDRTVLSGQVLLKCLRRWMLQYKIGKNMYPLGRRMYHKWLK